MDWITDLRTAIKFMEDNMFENISAQDVSNHVYMSNYNFQKAFHIVTGYSVSEYIRNRRLFLAANEIISTNAKIIDIALKYCYNTSESFTKAFTRFHGVSPMQMRKEKMSIKTFLPLKISITVTGGYKMDYTITKMFGFKVIGIAREFSFENSYAEIPKFWDEFCKKYFDSLFSGKKPESEFQKAIVDNSISEFGVCIGSEDNKQTFKESLIKSCASDAQSDFSPDCTEISQAYWRMSRN